MQAKIIKLLSIQNKAASRVRWCAFILLSVVVACVVEEDGTGSTQARSTPGTSVCDNCGNLPFDFRNPDLEVKLPDRLEEISGLSVLDDSTIIAVEDEGGYLYFISTNNGKVRDRIRFAASGDYEGVERVGDMIYVLRSDGDLYAVSNWNTGEPETRKIETELSRRFDTEGLAYDAATNQLLIACKEYPGRRLSGFRSIYGFDLGDGKLIMRPRYAINYDAKRHEEFPGKLTDFDVSRKKIGRFKPAGLAIDPETGDIFLLSSNWKALIVLARTGAITAVEDLPDKDFRQPEGISFDKDGNLYISNEGRGKRATLLRFNRQ